MIEMRDATPEDGDAVWAMLEPVIRAGETYALPRDYSREEALGFWCAEFNEVILAFQDGAPLGTYILRPNQKGGGAHVANCAYVTAGAAQGRGVARAMLAHSLERARERGYRAMQFNFVIASNTRAVALWESHGFEIVGHQPDAFVLPGGKTVDALVMHRTL